MNSMLRLTFLFLLLTGCSAELRSPLVDVGGKVSLPWKGEEKRQQVVFPAGIGENRGGEDSLTRLYGPDWKDLQDQYEEYRFNGEGP